MAAAVAERAPHTTSLNPFASVLCSARASSCAALFVTRLSAARPRRTRSQIFTSLLSARGELSPRGEMHAAARIRRPSTVRVQLERSNGGIWFVTLVR